MRILLTNDDGIDAPGLAALAEVAAEFGRPVIVAPTVCHSAKSHAVTMDGPLRVEPRAIFDGVAAYACTGTPADCVRIGLRQLAIGPIDVVLSGINPGANVGVDVFYSGTVAAAREAGLLGVPGIAVSQLVRKGEPVDWPAAKRRAADALRIVLRDPAKLPLVTNVNLPAPRDGRPQRELRVCRLALDPWPMEYTRRSGDVDAGAFETAYTGSYLNRRSVESTDFHLVTNDHITVTPLRLDVTDESAMRKLAGAASRG